MQKIDKEELKRVLLERGIELSIWGCGCCASPEVTIKIDGEVLVDESKYLLNMRDDEDWSDTDERNL